MILFLPWIFAYQHLTFNVQGHDFTICTAEWPSDKWNKIYTILWVFTLCYILPLVIIATFYTLIGLRVYKQKVRGVCGQAQVNIRKRKLRLFRMLLVVVVVFFFSWLPLYSLELFYLLHPTNSYKEQLDKFFKPVAQWLGASNSCINPVIYIIYSRKMRDSVNAIWSNTLECL